MSENGPSGAARLALAQSVLTEAAIVAQLAMALLETHLPRPFVAAQFSVLNHLASRPKGQTPLQIARAFQVPKTSMTHSLAVLEKAGLVQTASNPDDGRSKLVYMTDAGRTFRDMVLEALAPDLERSLGGLAPGTLDTLLPHLTHLRQVLDAARQG